MNVTVETVSFSYKIRITVYTYLLTLYYGVHEYTQVLYILGYYSYERWFRFNKF